MITDCGLLDIVEKRLECYRSEVFDSALGLGKE
jgi:hypothetical protein